MLLTFLREKLYPLLLAIFPDYTECVNLPGH
jgi:hypothetical protein